MGMSGKFSGLKPPGFKKAFFVDLQKSDDIDGICKFCNQWAAELDRNGMCKDDDCQRARQLHAIEIGKAVRSYERSGEDDMVPRRKR